MNKDEIKVCVCPYCGESWEVFDDSLLAGTCKCFRCGATYIPIKLYKMFKFVFHALRKVKGEK